MRVDWCVSSWFRIKNTHSHTLGTCVRRKTNPLEGGRYWGGQIHTSRDYLCFRKRCRRRSPRRVHMGGSVLCQAVHTFRYTRARRARGPRLPTGPLTATRRILLFTTRNTNVTGPSGPSATKLGCIYDIAWRVSRVEERPERPLFLVGPAGTRSRARCDGCWPCARVARAAAKAAAAPSSSRSHRGRARWERRARRLVDSHWGGVASGV